MSGMRYSARSGMVAGLALALGIITTGCSKDELTHGALGTPQGPTGHEVVALNDNNELLRFNSLSPGTILGTTALTGLGAGEKMIQIDFSPDGLLYGVTDGNQLYQIDTATGAVTLNTAPAPFTPGFTGTRVGFDFDPVNYDLISVTDAAQYLRIERGFGQVETQNPDLHYALSDVNAGVTPNVTGLAFTCACDSSTTLYGIDTNLDALVTVGSLDTTTVSPTTGELFTVGSLGIDVSDMVGFDITKKFEIAYAAFTETGSTAARLYVLSLSSGTAVAIGQIGTGLAIRDITVRP